MKHYLLTASLLIAIPAAASSMVKERPKSAAMLNDMLLQAAAQKTTSPQDIHDLIEQGASVHTRDQDGYTPLMRAARNGNAEVCEALILDGASVLDFCTAHYWLGSDRLLFRLTPLHLAIKNGHVEYVSGSFTIWS